VAAAGAAVVVFSVVVAPDIRIVIKATAEESSDRFVGIAGYSAEQADVGVSQCHLRTATNAAADQHIYAEGR
jgi:hypothetical protein